jgi:hypothetical protein
VMWNSAPSQKVSLNTWRGWIVNSSTGLLITRALLTITAVSKNLILTGRRAHIFAILTQPNFYRLCSVSTNGCNQRY